MTTHTPDNSRRRFIKLTAIGLAAAPFANALLSGTAAAADMVSETDSQAAALGYKADAMYCPKTVFRLLREYSGHLVSQDGGGGAILQAAV